MKHAQQMNFAIWAALLLLLGFMPGRMAEAQDLGASLIDDFAAARSYLAGAERGALARIETAVAEAQKNAGPTVTQLERQLLNLLENSQSTREARRFACQQLALVGGEAAVLPLTKVLQEAGMADVAGTALQLIDDPGVIDEVLPLLQITSGPTRLAVIEILGARRAARAVGQLSALAIRDEVVTAEAAIAALGQLGIAPAGRALLRLRGPLFGNPTHRDAVDRAILHCAEMLSKDRDRRLGVVLAHALLHEKTVEPVQLEALRLLVQLNDAEGIALALAAFDHPVKMKNRAADSEHRRTILGQEGDHTVTHALLKKMATTTGPAQTILILNILAERGDPTAEPAVLDLYHANTDAIVTTAAVTALGKIGTAKSVTALVAALQAGNPNAAKALMQLRDPATDAQISVILTQDNLTNEVKVKLQTVLAIRKQSPTKP